MTLPAEWNFTAYALTPRDGDGRPEIWSGSYAPGETVRPYPAPRTFLQPSGTRAGPLVQVVTSGTPVDGQIVHRLGQPSALPVEPRIDGFAIGRLLTAIARPRRDPLRGRPVFDVDATLTCAFQVARLAVPAGHMLKTAYGLDRLTVRLGMKAREDQWASADVRAEGLYPELYLAAEPSASTPRRGHESAKRHRSADSHPPRLYAHATRSYQYAQYSAAAHDASLQGVQSNPAGSEEHVSTHASIESSPGGQRFDRLRAQEVCYPGSCTALSSDQEPRSARTVSLGWGWEDSLDPDSEAFARIAAGSATTHSAVDCRRPPGWCHEFDLSCLLDEPAPLSQGLVHFWLGVWVTSDAGHPIDFPDGGPAWELPRSAEEASLHYWIAEDSAAMGFWALAAH